MPPTCKQVRPRHVLLAIASASTNCAAGAVWFPLRGSVAVHAKNKMNTAEIANSSTAEMDADQEVRLSERNTLWGYMKLSQFRIRDAETGQAVKTVTPDKKYQLEVEVLNAHKAEPEVWYGDVQLRVVPRGNAIQFYRDNHYENKMDRFDSDLFLLRGNEPRMFIIPFVFKAVASTATSSLGFSVGVYGHERKRQHGWVSGKA